MSEDNNKLYILFFLDVFLATTLFWLWPTFLSLFDLATRVNGSSFETMMIRLSAFFLTPLYLLVLLMCIYVMINFITIVVAKLSNLHKIKNSYFILFLSLSIVIYALGQYVIEENFSEYPVKFGPAGNENFTNYILCKNLDYTYTVDGSRLLCSLDLSFKKSFFDDEFNETNHIFLIINKTHDIDLHTKEVNISKNKIKSDFPEFKISKEDNVGYFSFSYVKNGVLRIAHIGYIDRKIESLEEIEKKESQRKAAIILLITIILFSVPSAVGNLKKILED